MIWGSQYDAMLIWVLQGNDKDKVKASSKQHGPDPTGSEPSDIINNIYDLGNNLCEWTLEAYDAHNRVGRGGTYNNSYSPSGCNSIAGSSVIIGEYTSRLTLYVK